jgi:hypothetical protein
MTIPSVVSKKENSACSTRSPSDTLCLGLLLFLALLVFGGARAALSLGLLLRVQSDLVCDFEQSGHVLGNGTVLLNMCGGSDLDGGNHVVEFVARAALRSSVAASRGGALVANEVALGLGAGGGLAARPCALGSRASRSAVGDSGGADSLALCGQADVLAKRATRGLAVLTGATNLALGLLATDIASSFSELLATELASGLLALWLADGRAGGGVARPLAVREARALCRKAYLLEAGSVGKGHILCSRCSDE